MCTDRPTTKSAEHNQATMAIFKGILFVLLIAMTAADMAMKMDTSQVKIASEAGSMEFRRQLGNTSELSDPVKIKMAEVVQIGADGLEVTDCAKNGNPLFSMFNPMKRFANFAGKTFNIDAMRENAAMPNAGSLKASMTKFSADLGADVGKLAIDLALAEEAGEVVVGGETQALEKGDMKFNIELSEWKWCGEEDATGAAKFLDVYMEVKGKLTPQMKHARSAAVPASFDIGDNMTVSFSGKVGTCLVSTLPGMQHQINVNDLLQTCRGVTSR